jgi:hypothetical protein
MIAEKKDTQKHRTQSNIKEEKKESNIDKETETLG